MENKSAEALRREFCAKCKKEKNTTDCIEIDGIKYCCKQCYNIADPNPNTCEFC